ncbi:hypothetical protein [Phenylobacterium sp.]|uniref:hypothetical protein n=1 Tax=Phenylobacterium sp. TaxID=1871053 RepID=UPI0039832526
MDRPPALRRLIDLPGVADLEYRALLKREFAEPQARAEHPEIDACSTAIFGLTAAEAEAVARPADWDGVEDRPIAQQVDAFEAAGWDVTDDKRRPLRVLGHFNQQLWLAIRGVAGQLPFLPDDDRPDPWGASLAAEAKKFRRR